jgi:hypothetical protein
MFKNETQMPLCYYSSPGDVERADCLARIGALADKSWGYHCGDGSEARDNAIQLIITTGPAGPVIYDRTEKCRTWQDSNRTFVIRQDGDEFAVTDPFQ